jgi:hypothetical protein
MRPTEAQRERILWFLGIAKTSTRWRNQCDVPRPAAWLLRWREVDEFAG